MIYWNCIVKHSLLILMSYKLFGVLDFAILATFLYMCYVYNFIVNFGCMLQRARRGFLALGFIHFTLVVVLVITLHLGTDLGFPSLIFINSWSTWRSFELKALYVVVTEPQAYWDHSRHFFHSLITEWAFFAPDDSMNCSGIGLLLSNFNALFIIWKKPHFFPSCDTVIYW